jgi:hypothetical protein
MALDAGLDRLLGHLQLEPAGVATAAAVLFGILTALAALGAYVFLRTGRLMLVAYVLYVLAAALLAEPTQALHRAPAEFALCLLAVTGLWALQPRREPAVQRQRRRRDPPRIEPTLR